ncbi:hypothetical protein C8R44DRAFT_858006 [Mycena epipterygia]|nr:hypothetical protein C8R44DRAFT_858006 [Mycena epipterygia]
MALFSACLSLFLARTVLAALRNHSIDDAGPLVRYIPSTDGLCVGCAPIDQYDHSELNNGTVTTYSVVDDSDVVRAIEMNFTGSAIYIYLAAAWVPTVLNQQCGFLLDGAIVGDPAIFFTTTSASTARYNILAYANTSMPDGAHTFQIVLSQKTTVNFDYAIYSSSNDPETTSSSVTPSATSNRSISVSVTTAPPASTPKKKITVAAIVGGVVGIVGAIAFSLALASTILLCPRSRRRRTNTSPSIKEVPLPPLGGAVTTKHPPPAQPGGHTVGLDEEDGAAEDNAAALVAQVRALKAQVQRLKSERAVDSRTAGSDTAPVPRSLSTMKRAQTRAVRAHQAGYTETDALVHTDSGLRLTAGRVVEELPPTYVAD